MSIPLKVLIVEDSPDDADLVLRELTRGGYSVTSERVDGAETMTSALDRQAWDLVICDYSMPHFSGLDALRLLRAKSKDIPFIFLSGTIGEDTAVAAMKEGAQDYVMKGSTKRLLPSIKRELEENENRKVRTQLEQRIRHLERFEAIGRLASGIAHDFNNVIAVVQASAEIGELRTSDDAARERFRTIRDQSELAANLTRQLLAFARRQTLQREKVDLNHAISRISSVLQSAISKSIALKMLPEPRVRIIDADPTQIDQVLMNLALNARDAMPRGGNLVIQTSNVDLDEVFCRLHSYGHPGSYVLLTVSDTGVGMDESTREHIFEPFFTTKEAGKGTGLGLATVYGVVKQHGGFINVYSELGRGTTFRVYFPAVSGNARSQSANVAPQATAGTETILVAEDNQALRALAEESLRALGYKVLTAQNGQEAVRLFAQNHDKVAAVCLDIVMPNMGGPEAFRHMAAIRQGLPVIFTSGYAPEVPALTADCPKEAVFLQKPYLPQKLAEAVRAVLNQVR